MFFNSIVLLCQNSYNEIDIIRRIIITQIEYKNLDNVYSRLLNDTEDYDGLKEENYESIAGIWNNNEVSEFIVLIDTMDFFKNNNKFRIYRAMLSETENKLTGFLIFSDKPDFYYIAISNYYTFYYLSGFNRNDVKIFLQKEIQTINSRDEALEVAYFWLYIIGVKNNIFQFIDINNYNCKKYYKDILKDNVPSVKFFDDYVEIEIYSFHRELITKHNLKIYKDFNFDYKTNLIY